MKIQESNYEMKWNYKKNPIHQLFLLLAIVLTITFQVPTVVLTITFNNCWNNSIRSFPIVWTITFENSNINRLCSNNVVKKICFCHSWVPSFQKILVSWKSRKAYLPPRRKQLLDVFDIKTCKEDGMIVGHLSCELSQTLKFILDWAVRNLVVLTSTYYRKSPLVKGGMKISCQVTI